jgi:8-oxo-dGTP diphosphatase
MFNFKKTEKDENKLPEGSVSMRIKGIEIVVVLCDIMQAAAQAIVCEANNHLTLDSGMPAMFKQKGGKVFEDAVKQVKPPKIGDIVVTSAGGLPAQHIFHAVTTGLTEDVSEDTLRKVIYGSLITAQNNNVTSISLPVFGRSGQVPYEVSSKLAAQEIFRYIQAVPQPVITKINIACYDSDIFNVCKKNICEYLSHLIIQGPFLVVNGIVEYHDGEIILIERTNPPFGWSLPGGFVDYNESVEAAVVREVKEETNLDFKNVIQFKTYSQPNRDPRFHTVAVIFVGKGEGLPKGDTDARQAQAFKLNELPANLTFDHKKIIEEYMADKLKNIK